MKLDSRKNFKINIDPYSQIHYTESTIFAKFIIIL